MARLARARCTQERKLPRHTSKARAPAAWPHACGCDGAPRRRPHLPAGRASPPPSAWARPLPTQATASACVDARGGDALLERRCVCAQCRVAPQRPDAGRPGPCRVQLRIAPQGLVRTSILCSIVGLSLAVRRCSFRPSSHRAARVKSQKCEKAELAHVVSGRASLLRFAAFSVGFQSNGAIWRPWRPPKRRT